MCNLMYMQCIFCHEFNIIMLNIIKGKCLNHITYRKPTAHKGLCGISYLFAVSSSIPILSTVPQLGIPGKDYYQHCTNMYHTKIYQSV